MDATREYRRHWINKESPTISEIFKKFPRFLDYHGELIDREFQSIYPKSKDNLISKFPTLYTQKILFYAENLRPEIFATSDIIKDDNFRALLILTELLPITNAEISKIKKAEQVKKDQQKKNDQENEKNKKVGQGKGKGKKRKHEEIENDTPIMKKVFPNDELVKLVSEGTNVEDFAEQLRKQSKKAIQPYLITHLGQSVDKTFIQGDEWFIGVHPASKTITSFDLLYKTYYVLNVEYPEKLKNFYNFIDYYIFQMKINPKSMVSSLHTNIVNFKIDTNDKSYKSNKNNNSQDLSEDDVSD
ncbi:Protein of unknown function [Cotesia congregata]|uniref:Uncharacterized protein n=1 Tax=Cotesia congregata TaxID=51543 RepID=A0A8J2EAV6_COTCN|nr:Protein of unknown function [Cotesia congregata]